MIKTFLSDRSKEIIFGSILGDGSLKLHKPYKNARFSFKHSVKQRDYFLWKAKELEEISSEKNIWEQKNDGFGLDKIRFQSRALEELTDLYKLTHRKNKLVIKRKWLNKMSPLSLAVWWMDDGSIIANGRKGVICTDSFDLESQKLLANYLKKVWKVQVSINPITRNYKSDVKKYYRLWISSSEELKKFLRIILPHIKIESMLYKAIIFYKDSQLQQRWISEVVNLTGFKPEVVEKVLNDRKLKRKDFRK